MVLPWWLTVARRLYCGSFPREMRWPPAWQPSASQLGCSLQQGWCVSKQLPSRAWAQGTDKHATGGQHEKLWE